MPEVRIKTSFGEVVIPYSNLEELEQGLRDVEEVIRLVQSKSSSIVPPEPRRPKPGYEDIYTFTASGRVELLVAPANRGEAVGLILFAHDPERIPTESLEQEAGIIEVVRTVLTNAYYKKYFVRLDKGTYSLSPDGRAWIMNEVIPALRKKGSDKLEEEQTPDT
jgi:hypothetical protein